MQSAGFLTIGAGPPSASDNGAWIAREQIRRRCLFVFELRREQSDQDTKENGSFVSGSFRPFKRHDTVGDHAPFVFGDAGGRLEKIDALGSEVRPLDLKEVIEPVKSGRETVRKHDQAVASTQSFLTRVGDRFGGGIVAR